LSCFPFSLAKKKKKKSALSDQSLDELLADVCGFLKYEDEHAEKLKAKAIAFFDEETLYTTRAVLQSVIEALLEKAKLRVLWPYIKDLQEKVLYFFFFFFFFLPWIPHSLIFFFSQTGLAPVSDEPKKVKRERKVELTAEQLAKRKKECVAEWVKHGNSEDTLLFSDDGLKFACSICHEGDEVEWHLLRGPSDIERHCKGGANTKETRHAKKLKNMDEDDEDGDGGDAEGGDDEEDEEEKDEEEKDDDDEEDEEEEKPKKAVKPTPKKAKKDNDEEKEAAPKKAAKRNGAKKVKEVSMDSDDEQKPKAKKAAVRKKTITKKISDDDDEDDEEQKFAAKKPKAKVPVAAAPPSRKKVPLASDDEILVSPKKKKAAPKRKRAVKKGDEEEDEVVAAAEEVVAFEEDAPREHNAVVPDDEVPWPKSAPKLLRRIDSDPVQYECQWARGGAKEVHPVEILVAHYELRMVKRVNAFDRAEGIEFVAESLQARRVRGAKVEFFVRWRGYPEQFDSWEEVDTLGDRKRELLEAFEGGKWWPDDSE
jgi:hypothetical protein